MSASLLETYFTTAELAAALRVNPETIRRAARRGELQSLRFGHERRFAQSAVDEWLKGLGDNKGRPAA